jgi:hypothetical protein
VGIVLAGSDSSCFDSTQNVSPAFVYSMNPPNQLVQCQDTRLSWNAADVQGTPSFFGIIPGGQSFQIPAGPITDESAQGLGTGFSWTPDVRTGTQVILTSGDNRGIGSGGSSPFTVGGGTTNSDSCLNSTSPSSTPGSPAGGSYPTSTSGAGVGGGSPSGGNGGGSGNGHGGHDGSGTNVGPIVGGVVGGVVALVALGLFILFLTRRRRFHKQQKERPVDLLQGSDEDSPEAVHDGAVPHYFRPEPFLLPDPTVASSSARADEDGRRVSATDLGRSATPDETVAGGSEHRSAATRKSAAGPTPLRPVNIIQHDDAGVAPEAGREENAETIELPPAYNKLRS